MPMNGERQPFPTGLSWQLGKDELLKAAEVVDGCFRLTRRSRPYWTPICLGGPAMAGKFTELEIDFADTNGLARFCARSSTTRCKKKARTELSQLVPQWCLRASTAMAESHRRRPSRGTRGRRPRPWPRSGPTRCRRGTRGPFGVLDHEATVQMRKSPAIAVDERSPEFS